MPVAIQEVYTVLKKSFASTFPLPSPPAVDEIFNVLYGLSKPLTEKEINAFIAHLEKIHAAATNTDSLENKLYQFIACSHFSYFYGNFCRKNPLFSLKKTTTHKKVSQLLKTQCTRFNDALLNASLKEKTVIEITEIYIKYLIDVENSTMSKFDQQAAKITGFNLQATQKEAQQFRLELQQRLSEHQSMLDKENKTTVEVKPESPLIDPEAEEEEEEEEETANNPSHEAAQISTESEGLKNENNHKLNPFILLPDNALIEEDDEENVNNADNKETDNLERPQQALKQTNEPLLKPLSEKPIEIEAASETTNKNSSGFINYLMKILRKIVQLFSGWINKLRFHNDTPSSAASETPVTASPPQNIANPKLTPMQSAVNDYAYPSLIQTMQRQKAKQEIAQTENPNALASSTSLNNR